MSAPDRALHQSRKSSCAKAGVHTSTHGATVTETGSGKPALRQALQARGPDLDLIRELPSGPAACEPIKGRTHVSTRPRAAPIQKILLAPKRASTHVANCGVGRRMGGTGPGFHALLTCGRPGSLRPALHLQDFGRVRVTVTICV